MEWLISNKEPDALWVSVLDEEALSSGVVKRLVGSLQWYKKTPKMEVNLAANLLPVLRSGLERSYILAQFERLDIERETAEQFLNDLVNRGACRFGTPRYYYAAGSQAVPYQNGMLVLNHYLNRRMFVSQADHPCLELLGPAMERQEYEGKLEAFVESREAARQVCESLAAQGLLLSADSARAPKADHGPLRWTIEITRDGEMLDGPEWEKRLNFLKESFDLFYFQSRRIFFNSPLRLSGDFNVITQVGGPKYFWSLSFKIQNIFESVPVDLRLSAPIAESGWQEFRNGAPVLFNWNFTTDLRHNRQQMARGLIEFAESHQLSFDQITLLANGPLPAELAVIKDKARFRVYYENSVEMPRGNFMDFPLQISRTPLLAYCRREGCAPTASPYIDGQGDVYTCSLEGGVHLGNIDSGARVIETRRRQVRTDQTGACRFGVNPGRPGERGKFDGSLEACKDDLSKELIPDFTCP